MNKSNQHIKDTFFMLKIYVYPVAKNSNCYCKQIKNTFLCSELKEHSNFGTSLSSYFKTFISVYSDSDWTKKKTDKGGEELLFATCSKVECKSCEANENNEHVNTCINCLFMGSYDGTSVSLDGIGLRPP